MSERLRRCLLRKGEVGVAPVSVPILSAITLHSIEER